MDEFDTPEDLRALGRDTDREWREEMAIRESEAQLQRTKERGLPDVMWEAMQRGDEVAVHIGDRNLRGRLLAVRNDWAMLTTGAAVVGINLRAVDAVQCVASPSTEGAAGDRTYGSLRAFLTHLEADNREVRVLARPGELDVAGRMIAVADDHILLRDAAGAEWAIALHTIGFVRDLGGG